MLLIPFLCFSQLENELQLLLSASVNKNRWMSYVSIKNSSTSGTIPSNVQRD